MPGDELNSALDTIQESLIAGRNVDVGDRVALLKALLGPEPEGNFMRRHIGPRDEDQKAMLSFLGYQVHLFGSE
jgi:hypothetical protein